MEALFKERLSILVHELSAIFPEHRMLKLYEKSLNSESCNVQKLIEYFYKKMSPCVERYASYSEKTFATPDEFLIGVAFGDLASQLKDAESKQGIQENLYFLYLICKLKFEKRDDENTVKALDSILTENKAEEDFKTKAKRAAVLIMDKLTSGNMTEQEMEKFASIVKEDKGVSDIVADIQSKLSSDIDLSNITDKASLMNSTSKITQNILQKIQSRQIKPENLRKTAETILSKIDLDDLEMAGLPRKMQRKLGKMKK
jgi:hypothetical protein